jgi:F0F1-type ATP synthase membrane subunit a
LQSVFPVASKAENLVLTGISGAVEALIEMLHGITEGTAGKWTKQIFPWFATITLLVLAANWSGLIPGNETVGLVHHMMVTATTWLTSGTNNYHLG